MSNLYMDKEYVIAGYVIGDEATNTWNNPNFLGLFHST